MLGKIVLPTVGSFSGVTEQGYINTGLGAAASDFCGSVEPTLVNTGLSSLAGLTWEDTANGILYKRNQLDTAWVKLFDIDYTNLLAHANVPRFNAQTGTSYTFTAADRGRNVTFNNAAAVAASLPQATGDFALKWYTKVRNLGAGLVTITPTTSTIDGASALLIPQGFSCDIFSVSGNYLTYGLTKIASLPESAAFTGVMTPAQVTANQNNYNPTDAVTSLPLSRATCLRVSTDASRNFTGLQGGATGRVIIWQNVGSFDQVFRHDITSTSANRFLCPDSEDYTLGPNATIWLVYDATSSRWRILDNIPDIHAGWTLLQSADPAGVASVDFTNLDGTYDAYVIVGRMLPATDNRSVYFRVSTDNGSTFKSGASDYSYIAGGGTMDNSTEAYVPDGTADKTAAQIPITGGTIGVGNLTTEGCEFTIYIYAPSNVTLHKRIQGFCSGFDTNGNPFHISFCGAYKSANAINAGQVFFNSGNIASGHLQAFGIRKE